MNKDMVAAYTPKLAEKPFVLGNTYDDGLGILAGGVGGWRDQTYGSGLHHRPGVPPAVLLTGIIVNKLGNRFVSEDSYHCGRRAS